MLTQADYQDQVVRGLSHRMNNILTLFHGYLGLLLENEKLDPATLDGLAKIKEGARVASDLMDRTQALVRPSSTIWRDIDLGAFCGMLQSQFNGLCGPRTGIHLSVSDDLPRIRGDAGRIKTALVEMVKNACEATFAGGGDVWIELSGEMPPRQPSAAMQPPKWVSVRVSDAGPGVPEEIRERIFAPFFSTKKIADAAGLGLAVVEGVARQHEGTFRFVCTPDRTIFTLRLPASAD